MPALFGPQEGMVRIAELPLDGCRWCGVIAKHEHFQRWAAAPVGWHKWTPLEQPQIKERMLARRAARLTREPTRYHARTDWTGMAGDPEDPGYEMCADCRSTQCPSWLRVQRKLDRQRWRQALADGTSDTVSSGGWAANSSWPF